MYKFVLLFRPILGNINVIIPSSYMALHKGAQYHYPHYTNGETEAQEDEMTCPRSARRLVAEAGIEPRALLFQSGALSARWHMNGIWSVLLASGKVLFRNEHGWFSRAWHGGMPRGRST